MFFLILSIVTMNGTCNIPHVFWVTDIINIGFRNVEFFSLGINHQESQDIQYYLNFKIIKNNLNLITGRTEIFTLKAYENLTITPSSFNTDRFRIYEVELNESADTLKRILLSTGKLPEGNYILRFEIIRSNSTIPDAFWECPFEIVNEFGIEALSPGVPFGAPLVTSNEAPVFVWAGKCDSFRITIAMIVNFALSPEELLDKYKILEKDFSNNVHMFSYPREFPPLTAGYYIWRVTGFFKSSGGIGKIHSMPLCFKIEDMGSDEIMKILLKKLGKNETLKEITDKRFKATGNIMIDTKPITIDEFKKILLKPDVKVKEVRLK